MGLLYDLCPLKGEVLVCDHQEKLGWIVSAQFIIYYQSFGGYTTIGITFSYVFCVCNYFTKHS